MTEQNRPSETIEHTDACGARALGGRRAPLPRPPARPRKSILYNSLHPSGQIKGPLLREEEGVEGKKESFITEQPR